MYPHAKSQVTKFSMLGDIVMKISSISATLLRHRSWDRGARYLFQCSKSLQNPFNWIKQQPGIYLLCVKKGAIDKKEWLIYGTETTIFVKYPIFLFRSFMVDKTLKKKGCAFRNTL